MLAAMSRLAGKVCIVTGAGSGIGRASAHALAKQGARVVVADIDGASARKVAGEIGAAALPATADVSDEAQVREMVRSAVDGFGGLDVLHNNAADSSAATMGRDGDLLELDAAVWDRAFAVNARGVMLGCKHAIPAMLARGGGSIVNTSSVSSLRGDAHRAAYGASKGAVNALTLYVATMYGKRGIRCNAIAPGVIRTPALDQNVPREALAVYEGNTLVPRLGLPEDIAAAVVWLASDESAFVTGQVILIDGGTMSHHPTWAQLAGARR
jgi:NAD(P)-dependent dehydrogenase (short-subunit alcohol dehydrogenase family)